jgi:uncharacterized protein (DUF1499 family)
MKMIAVIVLGVLLIVFGFFIWLGQSSQSGKALGLLNNSLQPCPDTPNCVTSELGPEAEKFIAPLDISMFNNTEMDILAAIETAIVSSGGKIENKHSGYLAATFKSAIFGFVDDVEVRIVPGKLIHFRSASREGKSDFGANLKRLTALKQLIQKNLEK